MPFVINRTIKLHIELVNAMRFAASHHCDLAIAVGLDSKPRPRPSPNLQEPTHPFVIAPQVGDLTDVNEIIKNHDSQECGY